MEIKQAKDYLLDIDAAYGFSPDSLKAHDHDLVEVIASFAPCAMVDSIRIGISKILTDESGFSGVEIRIYGGHISEKTLSDHELKGQKIMYNSVRYREVKLGETVTAEQEDEHGDLVYYHEINFTLVQRENSENQ